MKLYIKGKVKELYDIGLTDSEIAKEMKVNISTVVRWRNKHKLKSNFITKCEEKESELIKLYDKGLNSKQISIKTGIGAESIRMWRKEKSRTVSRP